MPIIPDSNSATSKLGVAKFVVSVACLLGGTAAFIFGGPVLGVALGTSLLAIAAQGGLSGMIGVKAADSPK